MMKTTVPNASSTIHQDADDTWWENLISGMAHYLQTDQMLLDTGVAPKETKAFYDALRANDPIGITRPGKQAAYSVLTTHALRIFAMELGKARPLELYVYHDAADLLLWAIINDDDEATHDAIIMAASEANVQMQAENFYIETMVVEKSDRIAVPNHYIALPLPAPHGKG